MQTKSSALEPGSNGHASDSTLPRALSREFHDFVADIEDFVKATTSLTGEELARARARLGERVAAAKQSAQRVGGELAQRARATAGAADDYVHEYPWQALGIGTAAGLLLGLVLARRT
jgi:ElaB/YqjD/DUF883 family membrane-anchored ribosome-binding protein